MKQRYVNPTIKVTVLDMSDICTDSVLNVGGKTTYGDEIDFGIFQ